MPSADTPVPSRARSPRLLRLVLLCALGGGLAGLAAPGSTTAPLAAPAAALEPLVHSSVAVAPTVLDAEVRRTTRATRSRQLSAQWVRPVSAGIVSSYGPRWGRMHEGVDFGSRYGAPIRAVGAGTVIGAGYLADEGGYGRIVLVRHRGGVITAYAHMSKVLVHAGERVQAGDVIGKVGSSGHVTGPHLHFEVRVGGQKINPVRWLRRHGVSV